MFTVVGHWYSWVANSCGKVVLKGYLINTCIRLFVYNIMKDSVRNIDDFPSTAGPLVSKTLIFEHLHFTILELLSTFSLPRCD